MNHRRSYRESNVCEPLHQAAAVKTFCQRSRQNVAVSWGRPRVLCPSAKCETSTWNSPSTQQQLRPAFILVPSVLGGKWVSWEVWAGSGRFEPKEHRKRKDRGTFVVGVLGGGIPVPSRLGGLAERSNLLQWSSGRSPGRKRIWYTLELSESHWWL